jgi:hypothetical protein
MPFVNAKLIGGVFSADQKQRESHTKAYVKALATGQPAS